ncbi:MAG: PAS domain S-box protein [Armatimonadetes bacterium]|nr:PAS domain S-box protein [Armatimonadota bacterium]
MNTSNTETTPYATAATIVIVADVDLRIVSVNNALVGLRGHNTMPDGLTSLDLLDHIEGIDREEAKRVCETILAGGRFAGGARSYKKVVTTPELLGERSVLLLGPHFVSTDKVGGIVYARFRSSDSDGIVQRDIKPETFYEYLVERSPDLVFLADENGHITFTNQSVEWFTNISASAIRGKHISEIIHADDVDRFRVALATAAVFHGPLPEFQCRIVSTYGSSRTVVLTANMLQTANGLRILGICRDVTESAELREKLLVRNKALSTLNQIVATLSSARVLDEGLQLSLEMILNALGIEKGFISLIDYDEITRARVRYCVNVDLNGFVNNSKVRIYESGDALVVTSVESSEHFDAEAKEFLKAQGINAIVMVPLAAVGAVQPILFLVVPPAYELTFEQMEFMRLAESVLGPAIENARHFELERTKSLELEALAREAHHRIKNNLQMITGLLNISGNDLSATGDAAFARCKRQIMAVATVHDLLTPKVKAYSLSLQKCIASIAEHALMGMGCSDAICLCVDGDDCWVTPDTATALGIIVNEIVCNAAEHAFHDKGTGTISISIASDSGQTTLTIKDDGVGLSNGFVVPQNPDSGFGLVTSLVKYGLGGKLYVEDTGNGTRVSIII